VGVEEVEVEVTVSVGVVLGVEVEVSVVAVGIAVASWVGVAVVPGAAVVLWVGVEEPNPTLANNGLCVAYKTLASTAPPTMTSAATTRIAIMPFFPLRRGCGGCGGCGGTFTSFPGYAPEGKRDAFAGNVNEAGLLPGW